MPDASTKSMRVRATPEPAPRCGLRRAQGSSARASSTGGRLKHAPHLVLVLCAISSAAPAATYYVDCQSGSDERAGQTPDTAWKSTAKVSGVALQPGDSVLFKRGTRCSGALAPRGSGTEALPIRAGAYGSGPLPVIEADAGSDAAVRLFDQQGWHISNIETVSGNPYGIFISGSKGRLRHFRLKDLVVRDVTGTPKTKRAGLVTISAPAGVAIEDVVIDGVTASNTTQWAGIVVSGGSREDRIRDVTVRNSVVHDVDGDGIILFSVDGGLIERSAAWRTGLQPRLTIGTPNGIWTWTCNKCIVRHTEGFWTDSPGVDGGVYDIDWGNDDNVVEENYGHDAMGYCAAVFAAGKRVTASSVIRNNLCLDNGRSPKLARRQGDLYISTWDGGKLDGVEIYGNTFIWTAPVDAPVLQMDHADFAGTRRNVFSRNTVVSTVPSLLHSSRDLNLAGNTWWYTGRGKPTWSYGGEVVDAAPGAAEKLAKPPIERLLAAPPPSNAVPNLPPGLRPRGGRWLLALFANRASAEARANAVWLRTALAQYGDRNLDGAIVCAADCENLRHDWRLSGVPVAEGSGNGMVLISPEGRVAARWTGFVHPADIGFAVRWHAGGWRPPGWSVKQ